MATTEELLKKNTQVNSAGTTTGTASGSASGLAGNAGNSGLGGSAYSSARTDAINQMYDAQKAQREAELKSAYEQSLSAQKAAQEKIAPQYQQSANDLATQYERNRRNFNQQAAASGINTGAGSQAALAQNNEYLRAFGGLRAAEGEAQAEAARKMADLETQYKTAVASALADNDFNRAQMLYKEGVDSEERALKDAQILAQFGDFSGFASLYGQEQADAMGMLWAAQNPDLAYNTGRITADQYFIMTGKRPAGWKASGGKTLADLVDGYLPKGSGGGVGGGGSQYVPLQPVPLQPSGKVTAEWNDIAKEVATNGLSATISNIQSNANNLTNPQQAIEMAYAAVHSGRTDR